MTTLWPPDLEDEPTDDELLTPWEAKSLASIAAWDGDLTDRQEEKRLDIEEAREVRRKLWRQSLYPRRIR
jgi:hypothetical protein